jgi:hypothetical protein
MVAQSSDELKPFLEENRAISIEAGFRRSLLPVPSDVGELSFLAFSDILLIG